MKPSVTDCPVYAGRSIRTNLLKSAARFYVGLDLGQAQDYSAVAAVERAELVFPERDAITYSFRAETRYTVRHAERIRLGLPYPEVVEHVRQLARRAPLGKNVKVVVDATGVGAPVVDLLKQAGLGCQVIPVVITGADMESSDGVRYRVPKRDLMAGLQVAFQRRRLGLASGLRALEALREELRSMKVRMTPDGYERMSGTRDDLVLALALAWWRASREAPTLG